MDYLFSKVLTQLAMPLGMGGALMFVGALAMVLRRGRLGAGLALAGLFWIWLWATPAFSDWMRRSLEERYLPVPVDSLPHADAILVLGGSMQDAFAPNLHPNLGAAADRVWHAARLYHAGKAPLVVASGGRFSWAKGQRPEADATTELLVDLGVPRDKVLLERHSRTTCENARETKRLLADAGIERVLLVTSALHMPRAEATFNAAGISVVPAPTDYEVEAEPGSTLLDFLPDAGALAGGSRAFKEYLGLWVYQWRGWTCR